MARITGTTNESVYTIPKWLGLNEHPDGDTRLKLGEASVMENWRITRDGNLKRRPGLKHILGLRSGYEVQIAQTAEFLHTYDPEAREQDQTITLHTGVSATSDGTITLSGGTLYQIEDAVELSGTYYIKRYEGFYKIEPGCWTAEDGKYTLTPYRVRAKETGSTRKVDGMWSGYIGNTEVFLVACANTLLRITIPATGWPSKATITPPQGVSFYTDKGVHFFPFDNKVYILNGYEYFVYDGSTLSVVDGYRPLVAIAISPLLGEVGAESGETTGEYVNRLNGKRRVWISPDGTAENRTFQLPEKNLASIDHVQLRTSPSTAIPYTYNLTTGQVTISAESLPKGVNTYEIGYSVSTNFRSQVTGNLFAELFSGTQDTRIFLYGDGTNRALYSGMDYDGMPRADYFPDSYEVRVGDGGKITAMIRHYSSLITYKESECWTLQHGIVELATNELTPAVYSQPVNREIGNMAMGQVRLVNNNPITLHRNDLYDWSNSSYYTSNLSRDERQAKRISDRIQQSVKEFNLRQAITWDDNDAQEYYVVYNNTALVWNYAVNAWYKYTNFPASCMCNYQGDLYVGTTDGRLLMLTDEVRTDDGDMVTAFWKSGAMDFGAAYARKYCSMMWLSLKPLTGLRNWNYETRVTVSLLTDRKDTFREKIAVSSKARVEGEPFTVKIKLKAKKFIFYHLLLSVDDVQLPATVTDVSFRVRQTGYAK